jgi:uncharacterized protein with PQ loop repeat
MDNINGLLERPASVYIYSYRNMGDQSEPSYNIIENILVWSLIAGTLLSYVPQYYKIYQNKTPKGLSESTIVCGIYSCVFNVLGTIQQDFYSLTHCRINHSCYADIIPIIQLVAPLICIVILYAYYLLYARNLYSFLPDINTDSYARNSEKILQIYTRSKYHVIINTLLIVLFILINTVCSVNTIVNSGKVYNIISAIFSIVMWFPQIYMTYQLKTAHSLSLIALTVHSLGCFATVIYQRFLLHQNWLVIANYIIGGLSEGFIVCLIMYYRKCKYSNSNDALNRNLFSNIETTL